MQIVRVLEGEEKFYLHKPIFPEYRKRNVAVLLWQLSNVVPTEQRASVHKSFVATLRLNDYLKDLRHEAVDAEDDDDDCWWTNERQHTVITILINKTARQPRWNLAAERE